jgi:putative DNA primase/helicase
MSAQPSTSTPYNSVSDLAAGLNAPHRTEQSDILTALKLLTDLSRGCVELRVIMRGGGILRGFYDDLDALESDAAALDREETAKGIYFALNPVRREMLLQSRNQLTRGKAANDADIVSRRWLGMDVDPVRPKDTSATDAEHDAALDRAAEVLKFLRGLGWSVALADSGNGGHLLCRVDLPSDAASLALIKGVLATLAAHFSDDSVKVDLAVCNASRIWKLYGTTARKGEATDERPHREAKLLIVPDELTVTTEEQLRALLPPTPEPEPVKHQQSVPHADGFDELKVQLRDVLLAYKTKEARGYLYAPGRCHGSTDGQGVHMRLDNNAVGCFKGCKIGDILTAYGLPAHPVTAYPPRLSNTEKKQKNDSSADSAPEAENNARASQSDDGRDDALDKLQPTDMGNGYRFARQHRDEARFNGLANKWFLWDTKRWAEDTSGAAMRLAKRTVQNIYHEAAMPTDEEARKVLAKHAIKSEADGRLTAMLHQAQSELPVRVEEFDVDLFSLNCDNGIVDLRTGELRPHDRKAMHTKLSPVAYDSTATAPKWTAFLDRIFDGDASLIGFVQKAVGYSLTGDVSEQCLFLLHGRGENGKSVLLKTIAALVADYGQATRTETWMTKRPGGVSNDVAALRGARFVSAVETDDGQRLAESTVKALTNGDAVRARFLFQESFEFQPQFKIWLAANHKPEIRGTDHAIWRRIRLIPFNVTIPALERIAHLDEELRAELPGVLAWAVEGCLAWQREGLGEPLAVKEATADYKDEMDMLGEFFADRCEVGEHYQATAGELFAAYESWCQSTGEPKQSQRWLGLRLKERGFEQSKSKHSRFWKGIGLIRHEN